MSVVDAGVSQLTQPIDHAVWVPARARKCSLGRDDERFGETDRRIPVDSCSLLIQLAVLARLRDFAAKPWLVGPRQT